MKSALVALLIIVSIITMGRFEKKTFKVFQNGEIQRDYSDEPEMSTSNRIELNDNRQVRLAKQLERFTIATSYIYGTDWKIGGEYNESGTFYFFICTKVAGVDHAFLYKTTGAGAPTNVKDFGAGLPEQIIFFHDYIIVQFLDAGGTHFWYSTKTPTVAGSWVEIVELRDKLMYDWDILNEEIYITISTTGAISSVYKSSNATSFQLYQSSAPIRELFESNGFLYGNYQDFFVLENNAWRLVQKKVKGSIYKLGRELQNIRDSGIYVFNGDKFEPKRSIGSLFYPDIFGISKEKAFFIAESANGANFDWAVYSYDQNGILLKIVDYINVSGDWVPFWIFEADENLFLMITDGDTGAVLIDYDYNKKYATTGNFETTLVDEGLISPKAAIVKHKPLAANTSVKIYKKDDHTANYTEIINSNTVGAIKKQYIFPTGSKIDFTKFKVELLSSDTAKTPDDVQLEFLYLPIGLENAK